jgi:hypothetical protein
MCEKNGQNLIRKQNKSWPNNVQPQSIFLTVSFWQTLTIRIVHLGKDDDFIIAFKKLPDDRQAAYRRYMYSIEMLPEKNAHNLLVQMFNSDPDLYKLVKIKYDQKIRDFEGHEEGREFINWVSGYKYNSCFNLSF